MATYLEYISFKKGLKWYKRIFFPLFLNEEEYAEYTRLMTEDKTELDEARDMCYMAWNTYMEDMSYENKQCFEWWRDVVRMLMDKEKYEANHTGRDN